MRKQAIQISTQIQNHWLELAALNELKDENNTKRVDFESKKLKKLIRAKQDLLKTLKIDYNICVEIGENK